MSNVFTLYTQLPKLKKIGLGTLDVDGGGAFFWSSEDCTKILGALNRIRLEIVSRDGIRLSGFQANGFDNTGREKFVYQEWWLEYR
jgi:hypothetical protein